MPDHDDQDSDFARQAREGRRQGLMSEFFEFVSGNQKWWLVPLLVTFLVLGLLAILAGTGAAPFIYTLF